MDAKKKRNLTIAAVLVGLIVLGKVVESPRRRAEVEKNEKERRAAESASASARAAAETASAAASSTPKLTTVRLADLAGKAHEGEDVCTCGVVQSSGSSPDQNVQGERLTPIRTVYVSEKPGDDHAQTVVCTWQGGVRPAVKDGQSVCVQGRRKGAFVGDLKGSGPQCTLVPSCP